MPSVDPESQRTEFVADLRIVQQRAECLDRGTGKPLGRIVFSDGSYVAPVLANKTLYIVTQGADLIAYR